MYLYKYKYIFFNLVVETVTLALKYGVDEVQD